MKSGLPNWMVLKKNRFAIYWRALSDRENVRYLDLSWGWELNMSARKPRIYWRIKVRDLDHLMHITEKELLEIDGIGEKTAHAIAEYFRDADHREEIHLLLRHGVKPQRVEKKIITGHAFSGKTIVLTGSLENYTRDEASRLIKERGGHVSETVTKKTDYVVVGSDPAPNSTRRKNWAFRFYPKNNFGGCSSLELGTFSESRFLFKTVSKRE